MAKLNVRGVAFDMYGTVVDVGAVVEACKAIAPDPVAFNTQWRAKQLEYSFLRSASRSACASGARCPPSYKDLG